MVAKALGWSPAKISRYELGRSGFPLDEVEKLLDFYGVTEPHRSHLMSLAEDANQRGWWEEYADTLAPEYMEFIGLEAEATSMEQWQTESIPGLLQTAEYAYQIHAAYQSVVQVPPSAIERLVHVRMTRQQVLTARNPPLELSVVIDESVLLRKIGNRDVMYRQLRHLAEIAELPNVGLHVLPLRSETSLLTGSFVVFGFSAQDETSKLGDVVSTESLSSELYVEGETDTYTYRLFFKAFIQASLSPHESCHLIRQTAERLWT
jgi:hypothetical protein